MKDLFDPTVSAAMANIEDPSIKPKHKVVKKPKPAPAMSVTTNFPKPGDPYWKQHPLLTEHKDGSVKQWGEDATVVNNPNLLPKQMLPPVTTPQNKPTLHLSDKAKGYSDNYYRKNQ